MTSSQQCQRRKPMGLFRRHLIQHHTIVIPHAAAEANAFRTTLLQPPAIELPHGSAQLLGRHIYLNPADTVAKLLDNQFHKLDLAVASLADGSRALTGVALGGVAVLSTMGCNLYQQLVAGMPGAVTGVLEDLCGPLLAVAPRLLLVATAAVFSLWHVRTWWAANLQAATLGLRAVASGPDGASDDEALVTPSVWWVLLRLVAVMTACASAAAVSSAVASSGPAMLFPALAAAAAYVASLLAPAAVAAASGVKLPQASKAVAAALPLLLPVLGSEVVSLVLMAAAGAVDGCVLGSLPVRAVCGALLGASLAATVLQEQYSQRLYKWQAQEGDLAEVHLSLRASNGAVIDTTYGHEPLRLRVGRAMEDIAGQQSEVQEAPDSATPSTTATGDLAWVDQSRMCTPSPWSTFGTERFCTPQFASALDELLPGLMLGQGSACELENPRLNEGGHINPGLLWWQSLEDVKRKLKQLPEEGQVFWYPLGPGPNENWAPVRVNAVRGQFLELDGNVEVEGQAAVLEVKLVGLQHSKRA